MGDTVFTDAWLLIHYMSHQLNPCQLRNMYAYRIITLRCKLIIVWYCCRDKYSSNMENCFFPHILNVLLLEVGKSGRAIIATQILELSV